jgi:uncharacterized lipoprotein
MQGRSVLGVVLVLLSGCSAFRGNDDEYRNVRDLSPLKLPNAAETRSIKPLYPIPPGPVPSQWPKKFEAPAPKPLDLVEGKEPQPAEAAAAADAERLVIGQDGNGHPLLTITGNFNAIWDRLNDALQKADVKISDRDQRVGLYYLNIDDETGKNVPYQLRLTRGQTAYTLTLQKDDDTVAPKATTRSLFEAIVSHWPAPADDK